MEIAVFALGILVVGWVLLTAIRTVVLPRATHSPLSWGVFGVVVWLFTRIASLRKSYRDQDGVLALIGPVGLLVVPGIWMVLMLGAFTGMFWATDPDLKLRGAFHLAGSSITTLGFAQANGAGQQALAFTCALLGLLLLSLFITYLPSTYSTFQKRERQVTLLDVRAGTPPSAVALLERFYRIGWLDQLDDHWKEWEPWFAELEETHTTNPAIPWFRSSDVDRSWVTAAGTALDAASIWTSSVADLDLRKRVSANLTIRAGFVSLRRIADTFKIRYDPDPLPTDPISIQRSEFDTALDALEAVGVDIVHDRDQAWRDFAGWRVNYDTVLLELAQVLRVPYAAWTSDRSAVAAVGGRFARRP
ncbi:MAG: hypothetical protein O3B42_04960 [Actinomycetota bacterium]|nr:hypothetical protein [Actinomycetota bacterium]